jgi:hypothetical protein
VGVLRLFFLYSTNFISVSHEEISPLARYLPKGKAVWESAYAIHEYLGWLWYRLK